MIRGEYYRYQPSDPVVRQHYEQEAEHARGNPHNDSKPGKGQGQGNDKGKGNGHENGQGHDD